MPRYVSIHNMQILDGKSLSQEILEDLKTKINALSSKPRLDIILVGDDPASLKYVEMKQKKAAMVGIAGEIHHLSSDTPQDTVIDLVTHLNQNIEVSAFMVQLPLPSHFDQSLILNTIDPSKDADGLTATNLGLLFQSDSKAIASATPLGIMVLLAKNNIELKGKNAVIIGRSAIVGLPLAALLNSQNATVTICHSHSQNLKDITRQADILISAVGKANLVTPDMVKDSAVVVDVGTNFNAEGKLVGDVDFDQVSLKTSFITPVPGGVGPMTIASLLENTYKIFINTH